MINILVWIICACFETSPLDVTLSMKTCLTFSLGQPPSEVLLTSTQLDNQQLCLLLC